MSGTRGTTTDLSFQVMDGTYSDAGAPNTLAAFDDRELDDRPTTAASSGASGPSSD